MPQSGQLWMNRQIDCFPRLKLGVPAPILVKQPPRGVVAGAVVSVVGEEEI